MTAGQVVTAPDGRRIVLAEIGQTVLFDNERVRVWEVALTPGGTQPWHLHHNPYLVLCLESSPCHMDWLDGEPPRHIEETVGGVVFRPPSPVHMLTNDGDRVYRNRLVELKDLGEERVGGLPALGAAPTEPVGPAVVFESDETRVYAIDLAPGEGQELPAAGSARVLITLKGSVAVGSVAYRAAGRPWSVENTSDTPFEGRLIELKYEESR
ncbi:hypothetical protein ACIREM_41055 [Streptomyces shenzhenensis]|uniref:hypothetical protein n=1 Tax=Streptomyces shenzhenensis TaxID=943815 RepID=UPI0037FEFBC8